MIEFFKVKFHKATKNGSDILRADRLQIKLDAVEIFISASYDFNGESVCQMFATIHVQ